MRFSGRIRFENVRDDLDASLEVTDTHVRLVSGEETLGSWCLADVVANRLIADEFELDLDGEVVIFVSDDQVNFAYGAVQRMAEGWARFHSMNLVRRKRAIAQARRQNEPNRLDSVRKAFVAARDTLRTPAVPLRRTQEEAVGAGDEERPDRPAERETPTPSVREPEPSPAVDDRVDEEMPEPAATSRFWDRVEKATAAEEEEPGDLPGPPDESATPPVEPQPEPGGSHLGKLRRLDALPRTRPTRSPRDEPELPAEGPDESPAAEDDEAPAASDIQREVRFDAPARRPASEPDEEMAAPELPPRRERRQPPEDMEVEVDLDQADEEPPVPAEVPAGGSRPDTDSAQPRANAYRGGRHPSETSGWRAGLRSLFSRSNGEHEHSFVESTTPAGITRRVCLDCGHVSIGVADDAS